jgi:nucleotide-binding universal stress UspA family protein
MGFKKILIAVDASPFGAHAAEVGMEMARSLQAEVAFVTVVDPASAQSIAGSGISIEEWMTAADRDAANLLAAFRDRASAQPPALTFLAHGKPAEQILKAATEWGASVVVLGTHGRGAVGNILIGSVAQGVLHHACCPVLVVRAQG